MKYAIGYSKPNSSERRTRFVSLRMATRKEETLQDFGFETRLIPKSEFPEDSRRDRIAYNNQRFNKGRLWQFVPQANNKLICIRNGLVVPIEKCL